MKTTKAHRLDKTSGEEGLSGLAEEVFHGDGCGGILRGEETERGRGDRVARARQGARGSPYPRGAPSDGRQRLHPRMDGARAFGRAMASGAREEGEG